jgi:hypothetical protein
VHDHRGNGDWSDRRRGNRFRSDRRRRRRWRRWRGRLRRRIRLRQRPCRRRPAEHEKGEQRNGHAYAPSPSCPPPQHSPHDATDVPRLPRKKRGYRPPKCSSKP